MATDIGQSRPTPFLIGVAGGSNSGKTTIAARLAAMTGTSTLSLLQLDSYYRQWAGEPIEVRAAANYDHPDAFDWDLLITHLDQLRAGSAVDVPVYDFADFNRTGDTFRLVPGPVILVEGILVLWSAPIRQRLDLKLFVDAPADLRLIRRLERDLSERGRSYESVVAQYLATVRPSHDQFIEPSKRYADVIIPEGGENAAALEILRARVTELITESRTP